MEATSTCGADLVPKGHVCALPFLYGCGSRPTRVLQAGHGGREKKGAVRWLRTAGSINARDYETAITSVIYCDHVGGCRGYFFVFLTPNHARRGEK